MGNFRKLFAVLALLLLSFAANAQYDIDQFFARGRQMLIDGKYASAIENFNILARLDSTLFDAYFFRGIAKYNLGDFIGAEKDFNTSLRLNPIYTPAYHYRAITLSRTGKYDKALKDLAEAVDLRPSYTGLYFSRGVTYFLSQQFEKAVKDFNRFIKAEPRAADAYLNRGACYLYLGDTTKALADYNKAIKINTFDPEGYVRRSRIYAMQENFDEALKDLDTAIELDTLNTFAFFNRALIRYDKQQIQGALEDLNTVLEHEPGNALTLYNRAIIRAQIGDYNNALDDYDRVIAVNPNNVLAYFNRAGVFMEMGRFRDAMDDYSKAINLYPDFAKAYMNRAYVKNMLGDFKSSKKDYDTAQKKVQEYRERNASDETSFADTTKKYSSLIALDAEFAKKDFNDELLQHRDIDIRLRPLYRFVLTGSKDDTNYALDRGYENALIARFERSLPVGVAMRNEDPVLEEEALREVEEAAWAGAEPSAEDCFLRALYDYGSKQFNSSLNYYGRAVEEAQGQGTIESLYSAFYHMNRGALRAEMIDFISSIESNVQVLSMDDSGNTRARVKDQVSRQYDYSDAIRDMRAAAEILPDIPYVYYNLGNLYCLSSELVGSIESYSKAIELYPYMGDAYFNRGLVLIYLKDKEKGCIDLSRAGELGVQDAYGVIKKYCENE